MIHKIKGFSIVSEAEVHVFWNSLAFSVIQFMLAIWSSVPLPFLNPVCTSASFQFMYCWNLAWGILNVILLACKMSAICTLVWTFFGIAFFGIGMKTDLFQSYGHCWVFQICWHIGCSILTASSFRVWNSLARIPSPQLASFLGMLSMAHLISHSRMSGFLALLLLAALGSICHPHGLPPAEFWPLHFLSSFSAAHCPGPGSLTALRGVCSALGPPAPLCSELGALYGLNLEKRIPFLGSWNRGHR